jgi:uncharacterized protein
MQILWSRVKAAANRRKHGVSFEEASTALVDPLAVSASDPDHSVGEARWLTFGLSKRRRLLVVAHTEEDDIIRIISARVAGPAERTLYEEG